MAARADRQANVRWQYIKYIFSEGSPQLTAFYFTQCHFRGASASHRVACFYISTEHRAMSTKGVCKPDKSQRILIVAGVPWALHDSSLTFPSPVAALMKISCQSLVRVRSTRLHLPLADLYAEEAQPPTSHSDQRSERRHNNNHQRLHEMTQHGVPTSRRRTRLDQGGSRCSGRTCLYEVHVGEHHSACVLQRQKQQ